MSEPFSWMDEGQGMKGVWRTDGGKKERRREGRKAPQLSGYSCLLFMPIYTHTHPHTPSGT